VLAVLFLLFAIAVPLRYTRQHSMNEMTRKVDAIPDKGPPAVASP